MLTGSLLSGAVAWAADTPAATAPGATAVQGAKSKRSRAPPVAKGKTHATHYAPDRFAGRAGKFYELTWGVDSLNVKLVESGELDSATGYSIRSRRAR